MELNEAQKNWLAEHKLVLESDGSTITVKPKGAHWLDGYPYVRQWYGKGAFELGYCYPSHYDGMTSPAGRVTDTFPTLKAALAALMRARGPL